MSQPFESEFLELLQVFSPDQWESFAKKLFQFQFEYVKPFRDFCEGRGVKLATIQQITDIPSFPTHGFKSFRLATFEDRGDSTVFHTSGTTHTLRGSHHMKTTRAYDEACIASLKQLTPGFNPDGQWVSLIPSRKESPHSSLAHMVDTLAAHFGKKPLWQGFVNGSIDTEATLSKLQSLSEEKCPVFLMSTTSALNDFLEALENQNVRLSLPEGSRLFETGGNKGRRHISDPQERVERTQYFLGLPSDSHWAEYGMTEMSSPSWGTYADGMFLYESPSWSPWRILHPKTFKEVNPGEEGLLSFFDAANLFSVSSLLVGDWARHHGNKFEIIDRIVDTEFRGCSQLTPPPKASSKKNSLAPQEIREAKERLSASEDIGFKKACDTFGALAKKWSDPLFPPRKNFEEETQATGFFSPASITAGLNRTFRALHPERLWEAGKRAWYFGRPEEHPNLVVNISAGNLPVTPVFSFFATGLASVPTLHRPSKRGGRLLELLHESLQEIDERVSRRIEIVHTDSHDEVATRELFKDVSILLAQGDEDTLEHFTGLCSPSTKLLPYRSAFSLILVPPDHDLAPEETDAILQDIYIWEQQGCLSPQLLFAPELSSEKLQALIQQFHDVAEHRGEAWERKPSLRHQASTQWHLLENELQFDKAGATQATDQLTTVVTPTIQKSWFSTPGLLQIIPVSSFDEMVAKLEPFKGQVSSIVIPHTHLNRPLVGDIVSKMTIQQLIGYGTLQAPEFRWPQDYHDRLRTLR